MPIPITSELFATLRLAANVAMWREWRATHPPGAPVLEVPCIRNLVTQALPRVQQAWGPILNGIGVTATLTGVVCHGRPLVFYGGARACELGDMLLVHDHERGQGSLERRATIVQAKVFGVNGVTSRNDIQLALYRQWPLFTYTAWPGGLGALNDLLAQHNLTGPNSLQRDLTLSTIGLGSVARPDLEAGCRYGMIDIDKSPWGDPYLSMNPWRLCNPNVPNVYRHHWGLSLGGYFVRLLMGEVGRAVNAPGWPQALSGACHWSLMVEELLTLLPGAATVTASASAAATGPGVALSMMLDVATPGSHDAPPQRFDLTSADEEGAFSVILISTNARD